MPSRFFRLPVTEIGYVRMIVEAYDGLATVRSNGSSRGEIEWLVGEGLEAEADELAARLAAEVGLMAIERPSDWPSLLGDALPTVPLAPPGPTTSSGD
jgi:hypothetical protein